MQNSEVPIPRKDSLPNLAEQGLEERASIKKQVDELVKSGKGRRNSPAFLRVLLGDTHAFYLKPEDAKSWLASSYPTLKSGEVTDASATVSLNYPFRSRLWQTLMKDSPDAHLIHQPLRQVHISATVRQDRPVAVLYNLYLGGNDYPYHTQSFIGMSHVDNTGYPNEDQLKSTDTLLKLAEPFPEPKKF